MPKISFDADAQAFITAAGITNTTQQNAINTLVIALKGYSIWTKFKAIYPIVGGTASQHKFNLKDPRDLDAAFRLTFATGWTHSANGMLPNGATFADTKLIPSTAIFGSNQNIHLSYYSRSNTAGGYEFGNSLSVAGNSFGLISKYSNNNIYAFFGAFNNIAVPTGLGFAMANSNSAGVKAIKNGVVVRTGAVASVNLASFTRSTYLGADNRIGVAAEFSTKQCSFASIGEGLTDTEAANFYTAVQAFNTTLGRSIGTQTVSDADAQAFINAAAIDDQVQANAINDLVIGMKADGLWTKMKAIYPIVGGTASQHKFNLKDPRDLDAAFRLTFTTGWTHSANGMTPNGTSAYADTFLAPNSHQSLTSGHFTLYSRTSIASTTTLGSNGVRDVTTALGSQLAIRRSFGNARVLVMWDELTGGVIGPLTETDGRGFYVGSRTANNSLKFYKNASIIGTNTAIQVAVLLSANNYFISAINEGGTPISNTYDNKQLAFGSIGDGLTDTEATNYYNRVQTYQTTLGRQV